MRSTAHRKKRTRVRLEADDSRIGLEVREALATDVRVELVNGGPAAALVVARGSDALLRRTLRDQRNRVQTIIVVSRCADLPRRALSTPTSVLHYPPRSRRRGW